MDLKKIITIGLTAITLGITSCNQQPKICEDNTEAVEYAVQTGFSIEESELFQPLGKKCSLTNEDKEFIRLMYKAEEKGEITPEGLEKIILRFGTEDETGEPYTISKPELNATKYAYYKIYPEFKSIDSTIKFQEWMIKGFLPLNVGAVLQGVPEENMGGLSFPIVTNIDYTGDGKLDNFMSLPGVLTADSDKIKETANGIKTGCGDAVEILREGYDFTIKVEYDTYFINTTFTDLKLVHIVKEINEEGEWRYSPYGSYSLYFIPPYRDSSLYPEDFMILVVHSYLYKDNTNNNKPPELRYKLKGTEIDETGKIINPGEGQILKIIYDPNSKDDNEDYNYLETTPENTIKKNKEFFTKGEIALKTYYYKEIYDPRRPLGILPTTLANIIEVTAEGYIVDFSKSMSGPEITNNPSDKITCKVIYKYSKDK